MLERETANEERTGNGSQGNQRRCGFDWKEQSIKVRADNEDRLCQCVRKRAFVTKLIDFYMKRLWETNYK